MNQFNFGSFITKFIQTSLLGSGSSNMRSGLPSDVKFKLPSDAVLKNVIQKELSNAQIMKNLSQSANSGLRMNDLAYLEKSLYVKDLMSLPKSLQEALVLMQKAANANEMAAKLMAKSISAELISELIQKGGKEALNKLVLAMSNAAKQGITDLSQFKEAMKYINASVSIAGQGDINQTIKTLMLLYLPWLPLQENVDFELEIEGSNDEDKDVETSVTVMISTKNYGNIKITLILTKSSAISIIIVCPQDFPKEELLKRLSKESKTHSIQSDILFEDKKITQVDNGEKQAKVTLSNMKDVNPFLLLMVNAAIRHTIEIDTLAG